MKMSNTYRQNKKMRLDAGKGRLGVGTTSQSSLVTFLEPWK